MRTYEGEPRPISEVARLGYCGGEPEGRIALVERVNGTSRDEVEKRFPAANADEVGIPLQWELLPGTHVLDVVLYEQREKDESARLGSRRIEFTASANTSYRIRVTEAPAGSPEVEVVRDEPPPQPEGTTPRYP